MKHPVTIDNHTAKVIAGMLKGYITLLRALPDGPDEVCCLLDNECGDAIKMRAMLLEKLGVKT